MSKQHFDENYGSNAPENYELFFVPTLSSPLAKDLIKHVALRPGDRVLDVACGTGIVARMASQQVGSTGTVTGLDINPGMLAVARSVTPAETDIQWCEASAEAIPLPDHAYDVVFCQVSLQFMEDKPAALKEMFRVLSPGGRIAMNVPGPAGTVFTRLAEVIERQIDEESAGFVKQVFSLHDTGEIEQLMRDAGFREVDIQAKDKILSLPAPEEFFWHYVHSSPLAGIVSKVDEKSRAALEREVVEEWRKFVDDGAFLYQQRIVTTIARK